MDNSRKFVTEKKKDCLTDYFNNDPDWRKVVSVVASDPIGNIRVACDIAKNHLKMEKEECEKKFNQDSIRDDKPGTW